MNREIRSLMRRAMELRDRMTPEERVIWQELRGNRLGAHFRRQQVLAPYIVDFYCHAARLVLEIDGRPHCEQQGYDRMRNEYLKRQGFECCECRTYRCAMIWRR